MLHCGGDYWPAPLVPSSNPAFPAGPGPWPQVCAVVKAWSLGAASHIQWSPSPHGLRAAATLTTRLPCRWPAAGTLHSGRMRGLEVPRRPLLPHRWADESSPAFLLLLFLSQGQEMSWGDVLARLGTTPRRNCPGSPRGTGGEGPAWVTWQTESSPRSRSMASWAKP